MEQEQEFVLERIDDIPLLLGVMARIQLAVILDKRLGNHGNQEGVSTGWVACVWIAYMLSEGKHAKMHVQEWVEKRLHLLRTLTKQAIRVNDFSDDRLGIVLRRLSDSASWHGVEAELWQWSLVVHQIALAGVRLDSTSSYGYHAVLDDGLMQHGYSKDHRPDLPQLKLMAAVAEPSGQIIACDVHPGHQADDPLYLPLIERVRRITRQQGLLYTGDSKMAALATRAAIVAHQDYYLTVLPCSGETAQQWDSWLAAIVDGEQVASLIWRDRELLGAGYEFVRTLSATVQDEPVQWQERVQLVRSRALASAQLQQLQKRLAEASQALRRLTPPPGRGKRQYREEGALKTAIDQVLSRYQVQGLLHVTWQREETQTLRYVGPGRGGPNRPMRSDLQVRYSITEVALDEQALERRSHRLGWRAYVTNLPQTSWSLTDTIIHYRAGHCIERDFHLIKDRPLGLSPLFVRRPDQLVGLTRLLTLALRILTLIETKVRHTLATQETTLAGLYESQPGRTTSKPSGSRLLRTFARAELTRIGIKTETTWRWRITPLSPLHVQILALIGLPESIYLQLENPP